MKIVVDANVIFAALIKDGVCARLLASKVFEFATPSFVLDEFREHKQELLSKSKRSTESFTEVLEGIKGSVELIEEEDLVQFVREIKGISPDPDDVLYLAAALKLQAPIWSFDKKLSEKQNRVKVLSTSDLLVFEAFFS